MAPLLQQPERWGKRERSDILGKEEARVFVSFYTSASHLSHRCVCVHSAFYGTGIRTARESGSFLSSSGFCICHGF